MTERRRVRRRRRSSRSNGIQRKLALGAGGVLAGVLCIGAYAAFRTPPTSPTIGAPEPIDVQRVHVLGDSFAGGEGFREGLGAALPGREITIDTVSGSNLTEQAQRFSADIGHWKDIVVIMDGGLTDGSPIYDVEAIVAKLDKGCGHWLYVEPSHSAADGAKGSGGYTAQDQVVAVIRDKYPDNFIASQAALRGLASDAADKADSANGWVPRSLRMPKDPIHLNAKGNAALTRLIADGVKRFDAQGASLCQGPTLEQMQGTL